MIRQRKCFVKIDDMSPRHVVPVWTMEINVPRAPLKFLTNATELQSTRALFLPLNYCTGVKHSKGTQLSFQLCKCRIFNSLNSV